MSRGVVHRRGRGERREEENVCEMKNENCKVKNAKGERDNAEDVKSKGNITGEELEKGFV